RPLTNGSGLPPMRPVTTTSSPSPATLRTSMTSFAPAGSASSRYLAPEELARASLAACIDGEPPPLQPQISAATISSNGEPMVNRIMESSCRNTQLKRLESFRDRQAHGPKRRRNGADHTE